MQPLPPQPNNGLQRVNAYQCTVTSEGQTGTKAIISHILTRRPSKLRFWVQEMGIELGRLQRASETLVIMQILLL